MRRQHLQPHGSDVVLPQRWGIRNEEGTLIGAECSGAILTCNTHKEDKRRNQGGALRHFVPCNVTGLKIEQCIREDKYLDGHLDCENRADEEVFKVNVGNSSSPLLDLENILVPCNNNTGFECSGQCLDLLRWCNPMFTNNNCDELKGTTATEKTTDPQMCRNQSFWEQKYCPGYRNYRCTGDTPGQCGLFEINPCIDGSNKIQGSDCGDDVLCKGSDESIWWKDLSVCMEDQYRCDGIVHCKEGEDEANCTQEAEVKCNNKGGGYNCHKAYRQPVDDVRRMI